MTTIEPEERALIRSRIKDGRGVPAWRVERLLDALEDAERRMPTASVLGLSVAAPSDADLMTIHVYAEGLSDAQRDALFDRVADATHALDEQVSCVGHARDAAREADRG